jgi:aldose sugar dehydrogenase
MKRALSWATITASALLLVIGAPLARPAEPIRVEVLTQRLDSPWGLAQLPDGGWLVTERTGQLLRLDSHGVRAASIANVPEVFVDGQGGLLDVALHPQFASNSLIYLSFARGKLRHSQLVVARAEFHDGSLQKLKTVFESAPRKTAVHYAGSLAFMRDGTLLITVGDGFEERELAQKLSVLRGKVVRINNDGSPPADNPFIGREDANPLIWSYGHRNAQGLGIDPVTGAVYEISPFQTYEGMREPILVWDPSIAPAGLTVYRGIEFPEWNGDLLVGVLRNRQLRRITIADGKVQAEQILLADHAGRFRDVQVGIDGAIYTIAESIDGKERSGQLLRLSRVR